MTQTFRLTITGLCLLLAFAADATAQSDSTAAVETQLDRIEDGVRVSIERGTAARDAAELARSRAQAARDAAQEVRDKVREGVETITGQVSDAVTEAIDNLKCAVASQFADPQRAAFVDGDNSCSMATCEPYRDQLIALVNSMEDGANQLFSVTPATPLEVDFGKLRAVIIEVPGRILYPLHRILNPDMVDSVSNLLGQISSDVGEVLGLLDEDASMRAGEGSGTPLCDLMVEHPGIFEAYYVALMADAIALKMFAKLLEMFGEATVSADGGIHGYAHVTFEDNFPKRFADIFEGLSDSAGHIAKMLNRKLEFCLMLQVRLDAQENRQQIMDGQAEILSAIRGNTDLNYDGDTNLEDYAVFQQKFGAAGNP